MLGVEALQGLGIVLGRRAPDGECAFWILYNDDAFCLHVDHGLEGFWELPVPLGDLGPDGVSELILRGRRHRDFAILAGEQEPQDQPRFERGLAHTMARPDRHPIMLAHGFEGFCLPRFWICAENISHK